MTGRPRPGGPPAGLPGPAVLAAAIGCGPLVWLASRAGAAAGLVVFAAGLVLIAVLTARSERGRGGYRPPPPPVPSRRPAPPSRRRPTVRGSRRGVPVQRGARRPERDAWPPPWARIRQVPDTADELITAWVQIPGPHEDTHPGDDGGRP